MGGNKAMRRALETTDAIRVNANVPLIVDKTELIDPVYAQELLKRNKRNRPINWKRVEEYAEIMRAGKWELHAQGIVIDTDDNILTGQKRLWAIVYANVAVYMRVSRGNPPSVARLLDRGTPQTARDLATRETERKHSPTEASMARAVAVLSGLSKPTTDEVAHIMTENAAVFDVMLRATQGTKKTRALIMIFAAIAVVRKKIVIVPEDMANMAPLMAEQLEKDLFPAVAEKCWGKSAAFSLALSQARRIVEDFGKSKGAR